MASTKKVRNAYRSGFESKVAKALRSGKIPFDYESKQYKFVQPEKKRTYTPDFCLPSTGTVVECKGRLTIFDRQKLLWVKESNPDLRLVILFQNADVKIRKGSPTSYGDWASKHGFEWYDFRQGLPNKWKGNN